MCSPQTSSYSTAYSSAIQVIWTFFCLAISNHKSTIISDGHFLGQHICPGHTREPGSDRRDSQMRVRACTALGLHLATHGLKGDHKPCTTVLSTSSIILHPSTHLDIYIALIEMCTFELSAGFKQPAQPFERLQNQELSKLLGHAACSCQQPSGSLKQCLQTEMSITSLQNTFQIIQVY